MNKKNYNQPDVKVVVLEEALMGNVQSVEQSTAPVDPSQSGGGEGEAKQSSILDWD